jgi:hypothetical protein
MFQQCQAGDSGFNTWACEGIWNSNHPEEVQGKGYLQAVVTKSTSNLAANPTGLFISNIRARMDFDF